MKLVRILIMVPESVKERLDYNVFSRSTAGVVRVSTQSTKQATPRMNRGPNFEKQLRGRLPAEKHTSQHVLGAIV